MNYLFIICPITSLVICQTFKVAYRAIKNKSFKLALLSGSGGMPSSHSAFISSLTTIIGLKEGFDSSIFALALVISMITCYDAMSVRYESGMHAKFLNEKFNLNMKEELGHKFLEVIVGIIVGIIIAITLYLW